MSIRHSHTDADAESTPNRTTPRPQPTHEPATRPATARAPQTFSAQRTDRLENLVDRWNAAFANGAEER